MCTKQFKKITCPTAGCTYSESKPIGTAKCSKPGTESCSVTEEDTEEESKLCAACEGEIPKEDKEYTWAVPK